VVFAQFLPLQAQIMNKNKLDLNLIISVVFIIIISVCVSAKVRADSNDNYVSDLADEFLKKYPKTEFEFQKQFSDSEYGRCAAFVIFIDTLQLQSGTNLNTNKKIYYAIFEKGKAAYRKNRISKGMSEEALGSYLKESGKKLISKKGDNAFLLSEKTFCEKKLYGIIDLATDENQNKIENDVQLNSENKNNTTKNIKNSNDSQGANNFDQNCFDNKIKQYKSEIGESEPVIMDVIHAFEKECSRKPKSNFEILVDEKNRFCWDEFEICLKIPSKPTDIVKDDFSLDFSILPNSNNDKIVIGIYIFNGDVDRDAPIEQLVGYLQYSTSNQKIILLKKDEAILTGDIEDRKERRIFKFLKSKSYMTRIDLTYKKKDEISLKETIDSIITSFQVKK
jgi:hypothetical protein